MSLTSDTFNFDEVKMIASFQQKGGLESWLSDSDTVSRRIYLHPPYQAMRKG